MRYSGGWDRSGGPQPSSVRGHAPIQNLYCVEEITGPCSKSSISSRRADCRGNVYWVGPGKYCVLRQVGDAYFEVDSVVAQPGMEMMPSVEVDGGRQAG